MAAASQRERATQRALAQAREALISHAADRPIDAVVGPGYLPCPDRDNDGWAEPTCGSLSGHLGQDQRLGLLPWKTLGLPDLRDGHGERLWYAVSARHKGLLNCAASPECVDMSPPKALGTISVRGAGGQVLHDGSRADARTGGAAAVVLSPGPVLARADDGREQDRACRAPQCDARERCVAEPPSAAPRCDPANYLDVAPAAAFAFEDNARFRDRTDAAARPLNADGFIHGPVVLPDGRLAVNDRLAVVAYGELMARVMARVALEAAHCVRGAQPLPEPACPASERLGRIPDAALAGATCAAHATATSWWNAWKPHVLYALAPQAGLEVASEDGQIVARGRRLAVLVTERPGDCAVRADCAAAGCSRIVRPRPGAGRLEAMVALP